MEETKQLQERIDARIEEIFERKIRTLKSEKEADAFLVGVYEKLQQFVCKSGKRLRPIASIMAFRACGGGKSGRGASEDIALDVAVAFELLHNSTLIHDDVMDEDCFRRGKPTVWKMFYDEYMKSHPKVESNKPKPSSTTTTITLFENEVKCHCVTHGILAGNILVGEALGLALSAGGAPAASCLQEAFLIVNHGQILDTTSNQKEATTTIIALEEREKQYFSMSEKKTGWLFRCAIVAGARLAGAQTEFQEALSQFALESAIAFQLLDDMMDIDISNSSAKGHDLGSDIRERKLTLLVIRALLNAPKDDSQFLSNLIFNTNSISNDDILKSIQIIEKYSLESVQITAKQFVERAKSSINRITTWQNQNAANFFLTFADFVIGRKI